MDATPIKAMKKLNLLFSVLLCLSASAVRAEITPNPVFSEFQYGYEPRIAMNVDEYGESTFRPAVVYENGDNLEVTVFGAKFAVEKQFELKNVLKAGYNRFKCEYLEIATAELGEVIVTRNFFVKNDKWCVIVRFDNETGEVYHIIDEDGNDLGELPLLSKAQFVAFDNIWDGGTPYLLEQDYRIDLNEDYFQLYTFTGTTGIQAVKAASFNAAYPNPLHAGQTFTVDFAEPADDATFFCVIDMNGRQVYRRKVASGQTTYKLTGSRFGRGNYVYTVVYGDGQAVSGKLMAE
ncbi:MAG: T9SS type A sorting domain-containing protein [Muribaculaceae bacterium]|nr:T9SS type A sorting domain-containing protein [Muribaculaceae bacterium]